MDLTLNIMDTASSPYRVHHCSKCPRDTEYYCVPCTCDLCQCKENHLEDLQTIDHNIVSYHEKINFILTPGICVRHPSHVYRKYCGPSQVPVYDFLFRGPIAYTQKFTLWKRKAHACSFGSTKSI